MRHSGRIVRQVLDELRAMVAPGITTMDLERFAEKKIAELGAKSLIDPKDLLKEVASFPLLGAGSVLGASYVGAKALDMADSKVDENNKGVERYKEQIKYLKKLTHKINEENSHS